jgi:hypothetical protein
LNYLNTLKHIRDLVIAGRYEEARDFLLATRDISLRQQWYFTLESFIEDQAAHQPVSTMSFLERIEADIAQIEQSLSTPAANPLPVYAPAPPTRRKDPRLRLALLPVIPLAGIIIGAGYYLLSSKFYILLVFPLLLAWGVGYLTQQLIKFSGLHSTRLATLTGLSLAGIILLVVHIAGYVTFNLTLHDAMTARYGKTWAETVTPEQLQREVGYNDYRSYLRVQSEAGLDRLVDIYATADVDHHLSEELTDAYRLIETLFILLVPAIMGYYVVAFHPFCEDTGNYMRFREEGSVTKAEAEPFMTMIRGGQFYEAGKLIGQIKRSNHIAHKIHFARCTPDSALVFIKIYGGKDLGDEVVNSAITAAQYHEFMTGKKA